MTVTLSLRTLAWCGGAALLASAGFLAGRWSDRENRMSDLRVLVPERPCVAASPGSWEPIPLDGLFRPSPAPTPVSRPK